MAGTGRLPWPEATEWGVARWVHEPTIEASVTRLLDETGPPDVVFHAVGSGTVRETISDPEYAERVTVGSARAVLGLLGEFASSATFVYPSSCSVYGQVDHLPIDEGSSLNPISPYGRYKAEAEDLCYQAAQLHGLRCGIIRYFSLYGEHLRKQLIWDLCARVAKGESEIVLAGQGTERRDFLHVSDAARLAERVINTCSAAASSAGTLVVNGGTGRSLEVREVADLVLGAIGGEARVTFSGSRRLGDPDRLEAATERAAAVGFRPLVEPKKGIVDYASWAASHVRDSASPISGTGSGQEEARWLRP